MAKGDIRTSAVRARTAEFLLHLHAHLTEGMVRNGLKLESAETIADHVIDAVREAFGGEPLYIPKGIGIDAVLKHHEIYADFTGRNHHVLVRKYGVSLQWVYHVVRTVGRAHSRRNQPDLFAGMLPEEPEA
ncbi:MAG: hypothetical protein II007_04645 [Gammaproteobacteria bacterium]|nr:hypothetical protein [Gammaproteobacteria bacterium]